MKAKQILSLISMGVLLVGCSKTQEIKPTKMSVVSEKIKVILTSERDLDDIVTIKFEPRNTTNKEVTWSCASNDVLTLQGDIIKANKIGKAIVTATSKANTSLKKDVTIKVWDPNSNQHFVDVVKNDEIQITGLQDTYLAGSLVSFSVQVLNNEKEIDNVFLNDTILSTKSETNYEFIMPSKDVTINVTTKKKAPTIAATSVQLSQASLSLVVGESDVTLSATVEPSNTTQTARWEIVEGNDVININVNNNEATVHAIKQGTAKIVVSYNQNVKAECNVTVTRNNAGVTSAKYDVEFDMGTRKTAKPLETPEEVFDTLKIFEDDTPILDSISEIEYIYGGGNGGRGETAWYAGNMLKFGTTSVNGSITFSLNSPINQIKITGYTTDNSSKIRVGDSESLDWTDEATDNKTTLVTCTDMVEITKDIIDANQTSTITIDFETTTSLKIATTNKKPIYITAIEFLLV